MASEHESGVQDITTGAGSGLLISMLEKLNWFYLTSLVNTGVIDVKVVGSVLEEKISFKILTFSFKLDSGSYIISIVSIPRDFISIPQDFEILGWCPAGPVLPRGEKVPL